jgi:hypothetical protein
MHSQLTSMVAREHVKDMLADAARARRAREARRARRARRGLPDLSAIGVAVHPSRPANDPCPQLPCPPLSARAA